MRRRERKGLRMRGERAVAEARRQVMHFHYNQLSPRWTDWTGRMISLQKAQQLVLDGKADVITRMQDGSVQVVGYKAKEPARATRRSPCTLTKGTINAVADAVDGMEDLTGGQKAQVLKFKVWARVPETFRDAEGKFVAEGVYKSPTIRPRTSLADRTAADALLAAGGMLGLKIQRPAAVRVA